MSCAHFLFRVPASFSNFEPLKLLLKYKKVTKDAYFFTNDEYYEFFYNTSLEKFGQKIPCGQCIDCRLKYSRTWADRCVLEAAKYDANSWVTLTYDDLNLPPYGFFLDLDSGEFEFRPSLLKSDMQKFMKDLRGYFSYHYDKSDIRFYGCGEYGSKNKRPHFHILLFDLEFPDLKTSQYNKPGQKLFDSEILSKVWKKGIAVSSEVNWDTCAYTARYMTKKVKGLVKEDLQNLTVANLPKLTDDTQKLFDSLGITDDLRFKQYKKAVSDANARFDKTGKTFQDEFCLMSRNPGIARDYYESNKDDIYQFDEVFIPSRQGVKKAIPPVYFDRLYEVEQPDDMLIIKQQRRANFESSFQKQMERTDLSERDYLLKKEQRKISQAAKLIRPLED